MFVVALVFTIIFLICAIIFLIKSFDSMSGVEFICFLLSLFMVVVYGSLAYSYSPECLKECESSRYGETENTTTAISIDHSGTYIIIGKDLEDDFVFVLEDKSGNRYVVNVEREDYRKFETGDKLTCAFIEKISRDSGETLECSNFEVFDME